MEESDKTMALKKAYAEIILNTAKEAAARVMASERKAVRFQQDLGSTKDEALRLLVRLKQMIDAKTIEAEITSSNQQRRIDELEAQLQEAEDIITDLRSELRWVRDKFDKARINKLQSLNATNMMEEATLSENVEQEVVSSLPPDQGVVDTYVSDTKDTLPNQVSSHKKCGSEAKQLDGLSDSNLEPRDAHESELDIIMRNKEPELYRNGCTQRIRALERKILDGKLSPSADVDGQCTTRKDDEEGLSSGKVNDNETGVRGNMRCTVLALRARNTEVMKKPLNVLGTKKASKACKLRRRRKRRWGKAKATSCRSHIGQLMKPCQNLSDRSRSKTSMDVADHEDSSETHLSSESEKLDVLKTCKGLEEHLQRKRTLYSDEISIIRKGKRTKNIKSLDSITSPVKPTDQLAEACQESNLSPVNVKCAEDKLNVPEFESKIKLLPRLDPGLTMIRSDVDPISGATNVTVSVKALSRPKPASDKDLEFKNKASSVKQENPVVPSTEMGSEMVNVHQVHPDLKVTEASEEINESPSKADGNRLVKYTFQRKRKKGSLSDNDDTNNSPKERKVDEKENEVQDANESMLGNESSRGTRRLAQVARQLISLSGKRW